MSKERAIGNGVFGRERSQCPAALQHGPENEPLGFLAVCPLCGRGLVKPEPGLHRFVVVAGAQRASRRRRPEGALRAIDLLRHEKLFPRHHIVLRSNRHQRSCALGQCRMLREECLDLPGIGDAKTRDRRPPSTTPWNPDGEIGQRFDAIGFQRPRGTGWQP